jgi:ferredoxin
LTYLVTDNCIKCKHTDCVAVCPVDCFYEAENFLAINPEECIDCGVCVPECPVGAIFEDTELRSEEREKWEDINRQVVDSGAPVLAEQKAPLDDHADWDGYPNKYEEFGIIPIKDITNG